MRYEIKKDRRSDQERRKLSSASSVSVYRIVEERVKKRRAKNLSVRIVTAKHLQVYS